VIGARAKERGAFYAIREGEGLLLLISEKNLRSLLETFEAAFQELQSDSQGKTRADSRAGLEGGRTSPKKSV